MNNSVTKFIIGNYLKKWKSLLPVVILSLLGCISLFFIKSSNLDVATLDYFFVIWFMMSIFYIYYISDLATYDFRNKIIQFLYSSGYSRNQYLINKVILFLVVGFIHSIIIIFVYNFVFSKFVVSGPSINQIQILAIYPLIVVFLGVIDLILALLDQSKSKIMIVNMIIIIILPTLIQGLFIKLGNKQLLDLYSNSPFNLLSACPAMLNLSFPIAISTVLIIVLFVFLSLRLNENKDF